MQDYKGKVLHFDGRSYNDTLAAYGKVCQVINEAGRAYEELDSTFEFSQEVFKDMLVNRSANIHTQYAAIIDAQIKYLKFTSKAAIESMKAQIPIDVQTVEDKIAKIFDTIHTLGQFQSPFVTLHFDIANITVLDNKAAITEETKEKIKDLCETKIRTDAQNEFYNLCIDAQNEFAKVVAYLTVHNPAYVAPHAGGLINQEGNGIFTVIDNMLCINWRHATNVK